MMIENKGGAGGNIASDAAAQSPPDGYTMYLGAEFLSTNPHVYPKLSYDPIADLHAGQRWSCSYPTIVAVPNSSPAKTVQEFIAYAKSTPRPHLRARRATAPGRISPASCSSAPPASSSRTCPIAAPRPRSERSDPRPHRLVLQQHRAGGAADEAGPGARPRGHDREALGRAPDVPTIAESGLPGFDVPGWYAIFVPAKSPPEIVAKMNADIIDGARRSAA